MKVYDILSIKSNNLVITESPPGECVVVVGAAVVVNVGINVVADAVDDDEVTGAVLVV